jgi:ABC-type sugar transport system ATPase subunit
MTEILQIKGVRKRFPGVVALDGVDFRVRCGEVHVLHHVTTGAQAMTNICTPP